MPPRVAARFCHERRSRAQLDFWPDDVPVEKLRWSISRDKRLQDCLRKYYLHHYAARGGAHAPAGSYEREVYVLKHLRNRHMWVGEVVHELIERFLRNLRAGQETGLHALVERGIRRMRAHYAESSKKAYRDQPGRCCGFVEHEYDEPLRRVDWQAQRDRMERCMRTFFDLPLLHSMCAAPPARWLALESLSSFGLDGATIVVKPDFAWRDEAGRVAIVDWKTGQPRPEQERLQLAVYGMAACRRFIVRAKDLVTRAVYLDSGEVATFPLTDEDLATAEAAVRESLGTMRRLAVAVASDLAPEKAFPLTDDRACCRRCSFRRVCERFD